MNDRNYNNLLIDYYGELLTKHQLNVLKLYYEEDLSFSEIAEQLNITKAAVSDLINRCLKQLENYENKLKMVDNAKKVNDLIDLMSKDDKLNDYTEKLKEIFRG